MTNPTNTVETLRKLYFQGRYQEAVEFAANNWAALVSSNETAQLIGQIRTESMIQQQLSILNQLNTTLGRASSSLHQGFVGKLLSLPKFDDHRRLEKFGFSAGSQNEEDGILVEIFRRIGSPNKTFFEFGVGSGLQNCTIYFLLAGWRGAWVEVNSGKFNFIRKKFAFYIASDLLQITDRPITPENIDFVAEELGVSNNLDLLSIDIDGNDYFVFQAMKIKPRVIVIEYNGLFPPPHRIAQAYDPNYVYSADSYTGCSLQSLADLAYAKGYRLVGTNLSGLNAFFVREDLHNTELFSDADVSVLYNPPRHQLAWGGAFSSGPQLAISPTHGPPSLR
jgi:hypothetical protein